MQFERTLLFLRLFRLLIGRIRLRILIILRICRVCCGIIILLGLWTCLISWLTLVAWSVIIGCRVLIYCWIGLIFRLRWSIVVVSLILNNCSIISCIGIYVRLIIRLRRVVLLGIVAILSLILVGRVCLFSFIFFWLNYCLLSKLIRFNIIINQNGKENNHENCIKQKVVSLNRLVFCSYDLIIKQVLVIEDAFLYRWNRLLSFISVRCVYSKCLLYSRHF